MMHLHACARACILHEMDHGLIIRGDVDTLYVCSRLAIDNGEAKLPLAIREGEGSV